MFRVRTSVVLARMARKVKLAIVTGLQLEARMGLSRKRLVIEMTVLGWSSRVILRWVGSADIADVWFGVMTLLLD
jgi:hypothetical protein